MRTISLIALPLLASGCGESHIPLEQMAEPTETDRTPAASSVPPTTENDAGSPQHADPVAGLPLDATLGELDSTQSVELCEWSDREADRFGHTTALCLFDAIFHAGADIQRCEQDVASCRAGDIPEALQRPDCTEYAIEMPLPDCPATVREYMACIADNLESLPKDLEGVTCGNSDQAYEAVERRHASCELLESRCPALFELE